MNNLRTLGQERAEFALKKIANMNGRSDKFKPFSAGAPSMILQNGFGHALAFWLAKGKSEHEEMFNIVKEWLCKCRIVEGKDKSEFMLNISQMKQSDYLRAQKETLALLEWVKRFANANFMEE